MRKLISVFMLMFLVSVSYAQQTSVIIPSFDLVGGATSLERDTITRLFMGDLANRRVFRVADRGTVEKRIAETKWQMSDYSNNEKTARLNEGINANYLIIGTISKLGTITVIDAMLEDLNTYEVIGNSRIRYNKPEEAYDLMEGFVTTLVQNVTGSIQTDTLATIKPSVQNRLSLGITALQPMGGISGNDAELLTDLLANAIVKTTRFNVVDRRVMENIMREQSYQTSGWSSEENAVRLGQVLNIDCIVTGSIRKLGQSIIINASLLDVASTEILSAAYLSLQRIEEASDKMDAFAYDLTYLEK